MIRLVNATIDLAVLTSFLRIVAMKFIAELIVKSFPGKI